MNDHSPNDVFHASSFLQGHNAEYVEQLYARYADNPLLQNINIPRRH